MASFAGPETAKQLQIMMFLKQYFTAGMMFSCWYTALFVHHGSLISQQLSACPFEVTTMEHVLHVHLTCIFMPDALPAATLPFFYLNWDWHRGVGCKPMDFCIPTWCSHSNTKKHKGCELDRESKITKGTGIAGIKTTTTQSGRGVIMWSI